MRNKLARATLAVMAATIATASIAAEGQKRYRALAPNTSASVSEPAGASGANTGVNATFYKLWDQKTRDMSR